MKATEWLDDAERQRVRGDEGAAMHAYAEAARLSREVFDPAAEARAMLGIGQLKGLADDWRGAMAALGEAVARAMEGGDPLVEAEAHLAMANVALDKGRSKDGHDALLEAMALYRQLDGRAAQDGLARATRLYGEHLGVLGSEAEAKAALQLAKVMFAELGDDEAVRGIDEEIARLPEYAR